MSAGVIASHYVASAPTSYAAEILADSPALYLKFDEATNGAAADSSGNGHNGTHTNVTLGQPSLLTGGVGSSASYNGSSAMTLVANAGWMSTSTPTLTARVKWNGSSLMYVASRWVVGGQRSWILTINASGKLELSVDDQATLLTGATALSSTNPSTIGFVADGTTLKLLVNGAVDGSVNHAGPTQNGSDIEIGRAAGVVYSPLKIDDLAFWTTAVSLSRLAAQHAAA